MLRFEPNVRIHYVTAELLPILLNASMWSNRMGIAVVVNSIDDGTHGARTRHGLSNTVDLDTEGDRAEDLESLFQYMRKVMPEGYDVVHETDHVHVERDPKRAEYRTP